MPYLVSLFLTYEYEVRVENHFGNVSCNRCVKYKNKYIYEYKYKFNYKYKYEFKYK